MFDYIELSFLDVCFKLKVIVGVLRGYDNFDIDVCIKWGIWFIIVFDLLVVFIVELIVGLLLGLVCWMLEGDCLICDG